MLASSMRLGLRLAHSGAQICSLQICRTAVVLIRSLNTNGKYKNGLLSFAQFIDFIEVYTLFYLCFPNVALEKMRTSPFRRSSKKYHFLSDIQSTFGVKYFFFSGPEKIILGH